MSASAEGYQQQAAERLSRAKAQQAAFEERVRPTAIARGGEPAAVAAAFALASAVECMSVLDEMAVADALYAYWQAIGADV